MSVVPMIVKEIRHRKVNFLLSLLAVITAVAFFVSFLTAAKASNRETARLMLSMGYNLQIIAKQADTNAYLQTGLADKTMPQSYLDKLASAKGISYNHLLATLENQIRWRGMQVILTGLAPEVCPAGSKKPAMIYQIEPGTVYLGHRIAGQLSIAKGDTVQIRGREFRVARCLAETGGIDDVRVQCRLQDAQEILNLPDQISEIQAVDCLCFADTDDPVAILRKEITGLLPEVQVLQSKAIASARAKQRQMVRNLFAVILPFVVIACGVWIGALAIMNVRDRQQEIGIMRALGHGSGRIGSMFMGKALVTGVLGGLAGFAVGTALALTFGPDIFKITAKAMLRPELSLFLRSVVLAPAFALVSAFIPMMVALAYDPAVTLREQ